MHHELHRYLREVTVIAGKAKIQFFCVIVCKNPREHWILVQVIVGPTCRTNKQTNKHCQNNVTKFTPVTFPTFVTYDITMGSAADVINTI
jgi:hypothetical protein